jgi:hypothetical protein
MNQISKPLSENGFTVAFSQEADDKRITVTCHLRHIEGHSATTAFSVRVGGKADSETQADCKASTTAKRNALLQALNIVIRQDCLSDENDPHNEGGAVTPAQATELEHRVKMVNGDVPAFLRCAGAETFATIMSGKYQMLNGMLAKKERAGR